jgi:hypothetical protein
MIVEKACKKTQRWQQFDIYQLNKKLLIHYDATAAMLVSVIGIFDIRITTDNKLSG